MKRKGALSAGPPAAKRQREFEPDYCDTSPLVDKNGTTIWPAPAEAMEVARKFLKQWLDTFESWDLMIADNIMKVLPLQPRH